MVVPFPCSLSLSSAGCDGFCPCVLRLRLMYLTPVPTPTPEDIQLLRGSKQLFYHSLSLAPLHIACATLFTNSSSHAAIGSHTVWFLPNVCVCVREHPLPRVPSRVEKQNREPIPRSEVKCDSPRTVVLLFSLFPRSIQPSRHLSWFSRVQIASVRFIEHFEGLEIRNI